MSRYLMPAKPLSRATFLRAVSLAVVSSVLQACAPGAAPASTSAQSSTSAAPTALPTSAPAAAATTVSGEKVTLRLWHWDTFLIEPYKKVGAEFTKRFPNETVVVEQTSSNEYPQKITAAFAGGVAPDVVALSVTRADFLTFASKGQMTSLMPLIQRDKFDINDFYELNLKQNSWKGQQFCLPYCWNTAVWFFNENLFKQAGLTTPTSDWQDAKWGWNTYLEISAKLTKGSGLDKYWGTGAVTPSSPEATLPMVWSNGGDYFDSAFTKATLTAPETMAAFQFLYNTKKYAPGPEDAKTGTMASGRLGMWMNWDVHFVLDRSIANFPFGVVAPPAATEGGKNFFVGNAPGFGIPKAAKHQDDSWELLKFIMTPDNLLLPFLAGGNTPPRKSMDTNLDMWKKNTSLADPNAMLAIAKAKEKAAKNPPKISTWAEMSTAMTEEMTLVWADKESLSDGVKKVEDQWNVLLKTSEVDGDNGG